MLKIISSKADQTSGLEDLKQRIENKWPQAKVSFVRFPSGSASIDINISGNFIVLEYSKDYGFGLSQVPEGDTGWDVGHDEVFEGLAEVEAALLTRLEKIVEGTRAQGQVSSSLRAAA